jgi:putative endonuclease
MIRWNAPENAGAAGERQAAEWLRRERNYQVVVRNWRDPKDRRNEIDLVCTDKDVLVFVEVKARASGALVPGYFAVNRRKKKVMDRAIRAYLSRLGTPQPTFRFDIVEIVIGPVGAEPALYHFENIPLFSKYYRG